MRESIYTIPPIPIAKDFWTLCILACCCLYFNPFSTMIIVLTTPQLVIYYTHGRHNTHHHSLNSNSRRMVWGTLGINERSTFSLSSSTVRSIQSTHDGYQSHGHQPRATHSKGDWASTVGPICTQRPSIIEQGGITGAWPGASSHSLYSRGALHIVLVADPGWIITTTML